MNSSPRTLSFLFCADRRFDRDNVYDVLSRSLNAASRRSVAPPTSDLTLLEIDKQEELGAWDSVFLISMMVSIVGSGAIATWCLTHHEKGNDRIPVDSPEARAIVEALATVPKTDQSEAGPVEQNAKRE